ncbi:MAG: serine hydrolase domain-containing protein, partial [Candidatus Hermodarchaeota archaeon]
WASIGLQKVSEYKFASIRQFKFVPLRVMVYMDDVIKYIRKQNIDIYSLLIICDGFLIFEKYFNRRFHRATKHAINSCTKSIISALIGIAIDKGQIKNIDQKVIEFFPERVIKNLDSRKENMTIKHLLTMTTGLEWDETSLSFYDPQNDLFQLLNSPDWVDFVLDKPMVAEPGTLFKYNSGASHLLSAIIYQTSGENPLKFAREHLLNPLDATKINWQSDPHGIHFGGRGIAMTPRDIAKFGYLYQNNGVWKGEKIISKEWISNSTKTSFSLELDADYGYHWWIDRNDDTIFFASGWGGQRIIIIPKHNLVIIFTANLGNSITPYRMLIDRHIVPSIEFYSSINNSKERIDQLNSHGIISKLLFGIKEFVNKNYI